MGWCPFHIFLALLLFIPEQTIETCASGRRGIQCRRVGTESSETIMKDGDAVCRTNPNVTRIIGCSTGGDVTRSLPYYRVSFLFPPEG
uniref:Putative secreted protein n=1 Tax=Anopheles triannulatus TaxID=58253 RepID=A0A2M4B6U1_9DIPT